VHASGLQVQRLERVESRKFGMELRLRDGHAFSHWSRMPHSLFHTFDPAEPATGAAGQIALPLQNPGETLTCEGQMHSKCVTVPRQFDAANLVGSVDDSFAQREADAEILEVGRRSQHDDIRQTVVMKGNRTFFRDVIARALDSAELLALHADFAQARGYRLRPE
jgi:hypothetical protein